MDTYVLPATYQDKQDLLWINFKAMEFDKQFSYARTKDSIQTGAELGHWKFLAPKEIQEMVAHDWGDYESISSRIAQKTGQLEKAINESKGIVKAAGNMHDAAKNAIAGNGNFATRNLLNKVVGSLSSEVPKYKVDTSMVYQNTKRREYTLTFNLAWSPGDSSNYDTVFKPIRKLEELSCPELNGDLVNIKFPSIFRVYSEPSDIIKINFAAITSISPTWSAPFKSGYPITCELQITVVDIEPLYRKSFSAGGIIEVTSPQTTSKTQTIGGR